MKQFRLILFIIFVFLAASHSAFASQYQSEVKVGLKYGSSAGTSVAAASSGGMNVYNAVTGDLLYSSAPSETLNILMDSSGFTCTDKFYAGGITKISVQPQNRATIWCDGKEYRGYIFIEKSDNGYMSVINIVGIDDYVASVLGKEMSPSWPMEALKAQAICARNFVLCRGNSHKEYGFDVCATTHCQVYGGVSSEHENTVRAVKDTSGILAKYNGEIVPLYFFAASGGYTENVENVWGHPYGYLVGVSDPYENPQQATNYKWEITLTASEIKTKLENSGINIGTITGINIDSASASGRVLSLTFYGTSGSKTVTLEKCRTILGFYSQKYTVSANIQGGIYTTGGYAKSPLFAITSSGTQALSGYNALTVNGQVSYVNSINQAPDSFTFTGGGYGHGVGMSQWGARGMAENGYTYDAILNHYFANIVLE